MSDLALKDLLLTTLTRPRDGARAALDLNLPTQTLWMALALISITTSAIVSAMVQFIPIPDDASGEVIQSMLFYTSPIAFALINLGNAVLTIFVLFWSGRSLGGTGEVRDVLSVIVLLQAAVIALMLGLTIIVALLPIASAMVLVMIVLWGIWAMVSVIDVAHDLESIGKAIAVFLLSFFVVPFGLSVVFGAALSPFVGVS